MKRIFKLILILSIISIGCSKEHILCGKIADKKQTLYNNSLRYYFIVENDYNSNLKEFEIDYIQFDTTSIGTIYCSKTNETW